MVSDGAVDLYEWHPNNAHLYRTLRCDDARIEDDAVLIPNSRQIVYSLDATFYVYDLSSSNIVHEEVDGNSILKLECTSTSIAVMIDVYDEDEDCFFAVALSAWNGTSIRFLRRIPTGVWACMAHSSNGLLAVPSNHGPKVLLHNVNTNDNAGSVEVGSVCVDLKFNASGSLLTVSTDNYFIEIFDCANSCLLLRFEVNEYGDFLRHPFSDDDGFLWLTKNETVVILALRRDDEKTLSIESAFGTGSGCHGFGLFRRINGILDFQCLCTNILKLYRRVESENTWSEIE